MIASAFSAAMDRPLPRLLAYACLALSMSLVGSYVALSRPLVAAFPVMLLAWLRFGIATVAMLHWLPRPASEPPMTARTRGLVFLESFLGNFLFSICMLYGVSMTSAVSAGIIMAAIPAVVAVFSRIFLGERIEPRTQLAIACAATGIGLLAWSRGAPAGDGPVPRLKLTGALATAPSFIWWMFGIMTINLAPLKLS